MRPPNSSIVHTGRRRLRCCAAGLLFDRNWVVVREANGKFLTQRQKPMLALVNVAVVPATLLDGTTDLAACPDAKLVLQAPGMPELQVPLTTDAAANKKMTSVTVWEWSGQAAGPCCQQQLQAWSASIWPAVLQCTTTLFLHCR